MKALVVLSGGQDSTTTLILAKQSFEEVAAVTFDYGQRHWREITAARNVGILMGITEHEVVELGSGILQGTSPLTDKAQPLEQYADYESMDSIIGSRVEKTFVPMRNALFLTLAANRAACIGAGVIVTGVCEADNANYPDCRASFIIAQQGTINEALGAAVAQPMEIHTPLINMTKAQSIKQLHHLGVDKFALLAFTHTAYDGQYPPLGSDHATVLRAQGFVEAGLPDPLLVRAAMEGLLPAGLPQTPNYQDYVGQPFMNNLIHQINHHAETLNATGREWK